MIDPTKIERIAPDYWRNSQLSVARFYGAAIIQGTRYVLDSDTDELVRHDVYRRERRAKRKAAEKKRRREAAQQEALFNG